ncbi:MAG TPA: ATP-grasp domain-containing protein [Bryobacteraceae bacterium]|nr:ATP-grasp domain-containing protein [Bryobacteraceae bacterium]
MPRLLLFAATTGYQIRVFAEAARRLGVDLTLATDRCHVLEDPWGDRAIPVRFGNMPGSLAACLDAIGDRRFDAVVAVGDAPTVLAADVTSAFDIPFHPPAAVRACHDKYRARQLFQAAGLNVPRFFRIPLSDDPDAAARRATYPCVLKPLGLSASRGVIRANHPDEFRAAFARIKTLLENAPDIRMAREEHSQYLQVEAYLPGREFAVEGILTRGAPRILAIFDKPDPLQGPYFEETIYVTPSRENAAAQGSMCESVARAVRVLGLYHGPFHAELRFNDTGVWMLEVAARPIGGLCSKALRFGSGMPLEELILRHAIGEDIVALQPAAAAAGVMMIPIPRGGVYEDVAGLDEARAVEGVDDVIITAKVGQLLTPLPEGASYLGFIFARGADPAAVERALRLAHAKLGFRIAMALPTLRSTRSTLNS